jgi:hypothetical protein
MLFKFLREVVKVHENQSKPNISHMKIAFDIRWVESEQIVLGQLRECGNGSGCWYIFPSILGNHSDRVISHDDLHRSPLAILGIHSVDSAGNASTTVLGKLGTSGTAGTLISNISYLLSAVCVELI